jgi:mannan endo-1,6-alpha-mannosidase
MLARDLARTAQIAPFTAATILPLLQDSAKAAASVACTDGEKCLFSWQQGLLDSEPKDKVSNLGSQYSALQVIQQNLLDVSKALAVQSGSSSSNGSATPSTGGSSSGSGSASASATANAGYRLLGASHNALFSFVVVFGLFLLS